jgi:oxaloacetate decarboxylase alpha subunit
MMRAGVIDTTIRDGSQSVWASRMPTKMFEPILPAMDRAGFHSLEVYSVLEMNVAVRFLRENPWDRLRTIRKHVTKTPLRMLGINQAFLMSGILPDDARELMIKTCHRAGIDQFWVTAAMNDVRTAETGIAAVKACGAHAEGGIQFTISPVHSDEFFVNVALEFMRMGVDGIVVKDASGLLTPERVRTLIPAIRAAVGDDMPINVHSHCNSGLGPATNIEAIKFGANNIWAATTPLANGPSLPSNESMADYLAWMGYETGLDRDALREIAEHFRGEARRYGMPVSSPAEYDPRMYEHQMPGGMRNHFIRQLAEIGMEDKLPEVLEEMPRVRKDFGYPNVQTPFSQFIGTQALLNVIHGRYEIIPEETRSYLLGYYGRSPGPVDQDLLDKAARGAEPVDGRPGSLVPPIVDRIRREDGPFDSDEDLVLAMLFMPETLAAFRDARRDAATARPRSPATVVKAIADAGGVKSVNISM